MSSVYARDMLGSELDLVAVRQVDKPLIAEVHSIATSTPMALQGSSIPTQTTLALTTGYHVGPLFIVQKKRAPVIHGGTLGGKRRRAREAKNTPKWADKQQTKQMYKEAARMTQLTGEMWVVDHIVPLDGRIVCGLHWHMNMQVMHWLENGKKGWGEWPDMPMEQLPFPF